jgi:thiol-disulfide isomerase/thioredoxin
MRFRYLSLILLLLLPSRLLAHEEQEVHEFTSGSFRKILQTVTGQPAIIHFWGATCGPCIAELPLWGELLASKPDANVFMIHAEPEPPNARVLPGIISRSGLARVRNWAFGNESSERLRFEIEPTWQGELPATVFVAADGSRRLAIGPADFEEIRHWLDNGTHSSNTGGGLTAPATKIKSPGAKPDAFQISF